MPAAYSVELSTGGETYRTTLEVRPDPDLPVPEGERIARYEFTLALYALQKRGYEQGIRAYDLDRGREGALSALDSLGVERGEDLDGPLNRIEEVADEWRAINNQVRNWWTGLIGQFDGGPSTVGSLTGPSDDQQRRLQRLLERADEAEAELADIEEEVLPRLNALLEEAGVDPVGEGGR